MQQREKQRYCINIIYNISYILYLGVSLWTGASFQVESEEFALQKLAASIRENMPILILTSSMAIYLFYRVQN